MVQISVAAWNPVTLGYFEAEPYSLTSQPVFVETAVASGATRYKQDRFNTMESLSISCIMTAAQFLNFEIFYYKVLRSGLYWFEAPLQTSTGISLFDCHFTDDGYSAKFMGGREDPYKSYWNVSFKLEYIHSEENQPDFPDFVIQARLDLTTGNTVQNYITSPDVYIAGSPQ